MAATTRGLRAGVVSTLTLMSGFTILSTAAVPAGASTQEVAKTVPLKPLLLGSERVPTGWILESSPTSFGSGCPKPAGVKIVQNASEFFVSGEGRQIVERLNVYSPTVEKGYAGLITSLKNCAQKSSGLIQKTKSAALVRMSFPRFGNQSDAFSTRWSEKGETFSIYEVVIQSGNLVVTLAELSVGSPGVTQLEKFTRLALARLPFGGSPPASPTSTTHATSI
jgi:hypothetical protein